ncbi:DUF1573 domain-containing protein [Haloferula sp.]|uniref:DUF1573 domain-containing protein n=1 Tax=Haloferula sp. TaxID=2497595 RepID=UPI0032A06D95
MRALLLMCIGLVLPGFGGELTFEKKLETVEVPLDGRKVTADFKFENKSDEEVRIAKYNATCSCMTVQVKGGKLSYAPGESGVIRGVFDMGNFSGTVDKAVQIWVDDDSEGMPSITLTARIHIPVLVEVEPKTLRWDVGGNTDSQVLTISMKHDEPIKVTSATSVNPHFELELKTIEEGAKYELVVTPTDTETQRIGLISIETDCSIEKHAKQRAYTIVRSPTAPIQEK